MTVHIYIVKNTHILGPTANWQSSMCNQQPHNGINIHVVVTAINLPFCSEFLEQNDVGTQQCSFSDKTYKHKRLEQKECEVFLLCFTNTT